MTIENYPYLEGGEGEGEGGGEGGEQFSTYDGGKGPQTLNLNVGPAILSAKDGQLTKRKTPPSRLTQKGRDAMRATRKMVSKLYPSTAIKGAVGLPGIVMQTAKTGAITGIDFMGRKLEPAIDVKKEFDVNLPDDKKQKTTFDSYFKKVPSYFFSKDEKDEPYLVEYKIRTLRALASIKLYQTRKCLDGFFSTLEKCIDDAFIHGKNNFMPNVVEDQLKAKLEDLKAELEDYLIQSIRAPILDVNYTMKLHENIGDDDASSFIFYILQLCVINYYPKYLLDIISNIIQQIFTSIYTNYTKLTNGDNSNIKQILSNLIASINDQNDTGPIQAELTTHIDTYIKGINLQDEYSLNSRKVFFNALVNFAISISMYANREAIENTIASGIYEKLQIDLAIKNDNDPSILTSLEVDIKTKKERLDEWRVDFDRQNTYFEQKELLEKKEAELIKAQQSSPVNQDITDLEKTVKHLRTSLSKEENELSKRSNDTPIAIKYNDIVRLAEEIKILEDDGPGILKAVNEDKRKWVTQDYIEGIINDIWQTRPAGSNYKDEIFKHINQAVQSSSMFQFNVKLETQDQATTTQDQATTTPEPGPEPKPAGDPLDSAQEATMAHAAAVAAENAMAAVERAQQERAEAAEVVQRRLQRAREERDRRAAMAALVAVPEQSAAEREARHQELIQRQAAANQVAKAAEAEAARQKRVRDGEFDLATGGKRRTRRYKKRAGTRRHKKRAGTRRHKKRKNTTK